MSLNKKIRNAIYDFANGLYSGLPLCCIWFFVKKAYSSTHVGYETHIRRGGTPITWRTSSRHGYVQCDKCYQKNHVVKQRNKGCIFGWIYYEKFLNRQK